MTTTRALSHPVPTVHHHHQQQHATQALAQGRNLSLLTLRLDYNPPLGVEGVANLCRGLRTNMTLKQVGGVSGVGGV